MGADRHPGVWESNYFLRYYLQQQDEDSVKEELQRMVTHGIRPDVVTYNTLIHGYCSQGRLDDALKQLETRKEEGAKGALVDAGSLHPLLHIFVQQGDWSRAQE